MEELTQKRDELKNELSFSSQQHNVQMVFFVLEKQADKNIVKGIYGHHSLLNRLSNSLRRAFDCCGCRTPIEPALRYKGHELILEMDEVPAPEDIQW